MDENDLQTNGSSWGNYSDSIGDAKTNSGGYKQKNTGKSEYWKANNIYDLAGNVHELTQEKWSTGIGRDVRGGTFSSPGNGCAAAHRIDTNESDTSSNVGFRASFYL